MSFDLEKYYDRIGWRPEAEGPAEILQNVHMRHIMSIPFESLDPYFKKPVSIEPQDIFEKLVTQKRGGYCFETNVLINSALVAMGFDAKLYSSRIYREDLGGFAGYTHCVSIVNIDGLRYVCDVGYGGDCFFAPVLLEEGVEQQQKFNTYRMRRGGDVDFIIDVKKNGVFEPMLGINDRPAIFEDLTIGNYYTSTHPFSFFAWNVIAVLVTENGKHSLFGETLTVVDGDKTTQIPAPRTRLQGILKEYFGIDFEVPAE